MNATDFIKFLDYAVKMQKGDKFRSTYGVNDVRDGVWVVQCGEKILMLAMDGHAFYWERVHDASELAGLGGWIKAGLFPFQICNADIPRIIALAKADGITKKPGGCWIKDVLTGKEGYGTLVLNCAGKDFEVPIAVGLDPEKVKSWTGLYDRFVRHYLVDERPAQINFSAHNPKALALATAWLSSHSEKPRAICMATYEWLCYVSGNEKDWMRNSVELRPDNSADYGALIMLMREDNLSLPWVGAGEKEGSAA